MLRDTLIYRRDELGRLLPYATITEVLRREGWCLSIFARVRVFP